MLLLLLLSHVSRVRLCATPQMAAYQAPLSLGFSRQEYWSGLPLPSPGTSARNPQINVLILYLHDGNLLDLEGLRYGGGPITSATNIYQNLHSRLCTLSEMLIVHWLPWRKKQKEVKGGSTRHLVLPSYVLVAENKSKLEKEMASHSSILA